MSPFPTPVDVLHVIFDGEIHSTVNEQFLPQIATPDKKITVNILQKTGLTLSLPIQLNHNLPAM